MASPFTRDFFARFVSKPAATATRDDAVVRVPFAGTITAVAVIPDQAIAGADTNSMSFSLINKGLTGGDTRVAASKAYTNTVNVAAYDEDALTVSGTAANAACVAGDVLALSHIKVGTGLTTPDGLVKVSIVASA